MNPRKPRTYTFAQVGKRIKAETKSTGLPFHNVFGFTEKSRSLRSTLKIVPPVKGELIGGFAWNGHSFLFTDRLEVREHVSSPWVNLTDISVLIEAILK